MNKVQFFLSNLHFSKLLRSQTRKLHKIELVGFYSEIASWMCYRLKPTNLSSLIVDEGFDEGWINHFDVTYDRFMQKDDCKLLNLLERLQKGERRRIKLS